MRNIAIVAGGYSGEYEISIGSASVVENNIDPKLYKSYKIIITKEKWVYISTDEKEYNIDKNDFSLTINNKKIQFDCVFIIIHGTPGEDGKLQGYFDMMDIPYTGCNADVSSLTFNKYYCNHFIHSLGVNVANSYRLIKGEKIDVKEILKSVKIPCFVKPNSGGSSVGMSKVKQEKDLKDAILKAFKEDCEVLVEDFIDGVELTCGVIKNNGEIIAFPLTEIVSKKDFFDYEAKYVTGMADEITPARVSEEIGEECRSLSKKLYHKINCFGVVRFDYIYTDNKLYFLEVNSIPGMSENSIVPQQASAHGMSLKELYSMVIEATLSSK